MGLRMLAFLLVLTCLLRPYNAAAAGPPAGECGKAMEQVTSCSSLMFQFFLTGKPDADSCCRAVDTILSNCNWPAALTSLGFTPQQGNMLEAYCNASAAAASPASGFFRTALASLNTTVSMQSNSTIYTTIVTTTQITIS